MMYDIKEKNDFDVGTIFTFKIPIEEVDNNALRTIQNDAPKFLLPFKCRVIDDMLEITYKVGTFAKFSYMGKLSSVDEYKNLWMNILTPLKSCGDWFLKPNSFYLDYKYLYYNENTKDILYIYLPTLKPVSSEEAMKELIKDIAIKNQDISPKLGMNIMGAMRNFNFTSFLNLIRNFSEENEVVNGNVAQSFTPQQPVANQSKRYDMPKTDVKKANSFTPTVAKTKSEIKNPKPTPLAPVKNEPQGEINIDYPIALEEGETELFAEGFEKFFKDPLQKMKLPFDKSKQEKQEKQEQYAEPSKQKKSIFGKFGRVEALIKKGNTGDVESPKIEIQDDYPIVINPEMQPQLQPQLQPQGQPQQYAHSNNNINVQMQYGSDVENDETQLEEFASTGPRFVYIGNKNHPREIAVNIHVGQFFTIGRYNAILGQAQHDFEFDNNTKAVSRKHAGVERVQNGYLIVDMNSSAGTFLDGNKLPVNAPFQLKPGAKVSFGTSGADYIWQE